MAASAGHVDIVKCLVENGAEVNAVDPCGQTALCMAAWVGHVDIVKYLVENGAEVNAVDKGGETALVIAASLGHLGMLKFLVESGARVNAVDKLGRTALGMATSAWHVDKVKCVVENGAEVNAVDALGRAALGMAASEGHVDKVKCLVENGAEVNAVDAMGQTALRMAAKAGHVDIVKCLIENGAEANAVDREGRVALHMATKARRIDIVKYLMENGAHVNAKDQEGSVALHMAAEAGRIDIVKYLMENGAEVNAKDQRGIVALHMAARAGHYDIVKYLVENGAEVNAKDQYGRAPLDLARHEKVAKYLKDEHAKQLDARDEFGKTSLHSAAEKGDLDRVKFLVEQRAPLKAQDLSGKTALDLAVNVEVVKYLVENGAQVKVRGKWYKVTLHKAAEVGQLNVVKCLVENGGQVNAKDENDEVALHMAAGAGHVDVVKFLIENGAQVNVKDKYDEVPLHDACRGGHVDIVKFLVEKGAHLDARDKYGYTSLHMATWERHVDIVKYLVENGAEVNAVETWSQTSLHMAVWAGHVEIVKYLVENGAEVNAVDTDGKTALHLASKRGRVDVVKCLVENGVLLDAKDKDGKVPFDLARDQTVVNYLKDEHAKILDAKDKKINEVRSLAVQFTLASPCCIRVIPYGNNDTQPLTVCLYVDTDGNGIPHDVKNSAKEKFPGCEIKCVDLRRRPLGKIVTRLPSCEKRKGKEIFDLSRKIENNLDVFDNRLNVTAVCASYKVSEALEKEIPCVTVFVLGKGKIPAKETSIQKIKDDHGHLFDNAEFDVIEGYYRPMRGPDPWSQMAHVSPLRSGVGIGVQGIPGAGTLGGFLEDENGKYYILSNDHVLNPPTSKNDTLSNDDCPNGAVDDAGTSSGLKEDVNNPNNVTPNEVVHGAGISAGLKEDKSSTKKCSVSQVIEQPAKDDHDKMHQKAEEDRKNIEEKFSDVANLSQSEKDDLKKNDEYGKRHLRNFEKEYLKVQQDLQEIREDAPRRIGEYVDGLKGNVKMNCRDNEIYTFYVDVAIAKLDENELEFMTREKADNKANRCPLYGFKKIGNVVPTGEIVDLDTFVKEIREDPDKETEEKLTFLKIGRTTGLTDDGYIDTSFQKLFVKCNSFPSEKLCTSAMAHTQFQYCINCKPFDITEAELVKEEYNKKECPKCERKLKEGGVYSLWQHNCFVIRKRNKLFGERGDSGSLIFDNHGRAWGLLHAGMFSYADFDITLASPLSAALNALEMKCGKNLKLWCVKPPLNITEESKCEEPVVNGTVESM